MNQKNATVQNVQSRQIVNGNSMQQRTTVTAQHVVTKPNAIATTQVKLPPPANSQATGTTQMKISPQPVKNGLIQQVTIQQQQSQVGRQQPLPRLQQECLRLGAGVRSRQEALAQAVHPVLSHGMPVSITNMILIKKFAV